MDYIHLLPSEIKIKIWIYYLSYGTFCSNIIRNEINEKIIDCDNTLWRVKMDYDLYPGKKYMLQKFALVGSWNVLWDLRFANLEYEPFSQRKEHLQKYCLAMGNEIKKNQLLKIL